MKRLILVLLMCSAIFTAAHSQDIPPVSPTAISPNFTWYKKITAGDTSYYSYSNGNWTNFARRYWVQKNINGLRDSILYTKGAISQTVDGFKTFSYNLSARALQMSDVGGTLDQGYLSSARVYIASLLSDRERSIVYNTYNITDWTWGEGAGKNMKLVRYTGAGIIQDTVFSINKSTGVANFLYKPTFPTATLGDSTKSGANTEFVARAINGISGIVSNNTIANQIDTVQNASFKISGTANIEGGITASNYSTFYGPVDHYAPVNMRVGPLYFYNFDSSASGYLVGSGSYGDFNLVLSNGFDAFNVETKLRVTETPVDAFDVLRLTDTTSLIASRDYVNASIAASGAGVSSFNTRVGAVTLTGTDVNTALGYTAANDANVLHKTGTESFSGDKTTSGNFTVNGNLLASGPLNSSNLLNITGNTKLDYRYGNGYIQGVFHTNLVNGDLVFYKQGFVQLSGTYEDDAVYSFKSDGLYIGGNKLQIAGDVIQNQNSTTQAANFKINGNGIYTASGKTTTLNSLGFSNTNGTYTTGIDYTGISLTDALGHSSLSGGNWYVYGPTGTARTERNNIRFVVADNNTDYTSYGRSSILFGHLSAGPYSQIIQSISPTTGNGIFTLPDKSGTFTLATLSDTTFYQTVANFFPKADTRYLKLTGGTISNNIIPNNNNTIDLGNSSNSWRNIYTYGLTISSIINSNTYADNGVGIQFQSNLNTPWAKFDHTTGNLSLGSTVDNGTDKLQVTGSAYFTSNISTNGKIGIGTSTAYAKLDIGGKILTPAIGTPVANISDDFNGVSGLEMRNVNAGVSADFRFMVSDISGNYTAFSMPGTGNTGSTLFGLARATSSYIFNTGGSGRDLAIGTLSAKSLVLGTNGQSRINIAADGTTSVSSQLSVSRNVADGLEALTINQGILSSGQIVGFYSNSARVAYVTTGGFFRGAGIGNYTASANGLLTFNNSGAVLYRDVADSSPVFTLKNTNASSTGNILNFLNSSSAVVASVSANGSLVQASTATGGYKLYNTTDQTTNYENFAIRYESNILKIGTEGGGTGNFRSILMGVNTSAGFLTGGSRVFGINASPTSTDGLMTWNYGTGLSGNLATFNAGLSGSNNTQSAYSIQPTINQSGSSSYIASQVIAYEQATGSGSKILFKAGLSSAASAGGTITDKFTIDNTGNTVQSGSITATNIKSSAAQTTVSGSSSGTAVFSQPFQGSSYKKIIIYCSGLNGTATYTFPTAFVNIPAIMNSNGPASTVVTSLSNTSITITGASTTGNIILEGY
ncbi:beta strand repeat-containing protein [Mucilaginibacter segetis]|uniref:Uncharacterized protein n=1 Tax=Mucilaginibacter segetis TaxID=2793071 RepID=A0A934PSB3_9SPHI|nr:hypothetical protein [Mucilaginibacter segetis]MBK0378582.1 hypothetical protein [Mucilaginibacter segetis]